MAEFNINIKNTGSITSLEFEPSTHTLYSTYTDGSTRSTVITHSTDNDSKVIYVTSVNLIPFSGTIEEKITAYVNTLNYEKEAVFADVWIHYTEN